MLGFADRGREIVARVMSLRPVVSPLPYCRS
jgi:hypothetical protein